MIIQRQKATMTTQPIKDAETLKKNLMANVGIEPKTFALLARRSNQLS
jgi:hypothetical protein